MCGGGNNDAAEEANRQQAERDARIKNTQSRINAVFDAPGREAEIKAVVDAVRQQQLDTLNDQQAKNARQLKFATARGGQAGGSVYRDLNTEAKKAYDRGVLRVEQGAQGTGSKLRAADQDARARLISLATSGLDATTAAAQSGAALRSNLETARSDALGESVADAFSGFADTYGRMQEDYQRRRGLQESGVSLYGKLS